MKIVFAIALVLSLGASAQTTYYASRTGSNANPGTKEKPFSGYFRALQFAKAGDRIGVERGSVFLENNYMAKDSIVTFAYGEGDMPTFSGFATPQNWTNEGDNIWSTYDAAFPGNLFVLAIDGVYYAKGRTEGYRYFQKHKGSTATASLIDTSLNNTESDWTGYQVVTRKRGWVLDVGTISKVSVDTVNYGNNPGDQMQAYEPMNNYGYWFQNGRRCLKKFGDWYFDVAAKKVYVKFDDKGPAGRLVQISKITRAFNLDGKGNTFDGIRITGYNQWGVIDGASFANNTFINCEFSFCGQYAIYAADKPGLKVINCRFLNNPNNAVTGLRDKVGSNGWQIDGNYFYNTGMWGGMGKSGDVAYEAIAVEGDDATITRNKIIRTGYNAIYFKGSGALIEGNVIDTVVAVKDDGAGIYTFQHDIITNGKRRIIRNNIVRHALGVPDGVAPADVDFGKGFNGYIDEHASDVDFYGNDFSDASTANLFLHNAHSINIDSNKLSGAPVNIRIRTFDVNNPTSAVNISRNTVLSGTGQVAIRIDTDGDNPKFGSIDGNVYVSPETNPKLFTIKQGRGTTYKNSTVTLATWRTAIAGDVNSSLQLLSNYKPGQPTDTTVIIPLPPLPPPPAPTYLFKVITPDGKVWGYDNELKQFAEVKE